MTLILIIFGALTSLVGLIIIFNPDFIFGRIKENYEKPGMYITAVVLRLALGALFILQSDVSKFPLLMEIIGWFSIAAALTLVAAGRKIFNRIISWALSISRPLLRLGGIVAVLFGVFIVYAFV